MAKRDTVLAIALALTAGALIAVRRSSGAIERVLSASAITAQARDVAEVFGSQPLTLGTTVAGPWNFTVWVVTRRSGYFYEIP